MNKTIAEAVAFIDAVDGVCHDGATYGVGAPFLALAESVKHANHLIVAAETATLKIPVLLPVKYLCRC